MSSLSAVARDKGVDEARVGETWWMKTGGMRCGKVEGKTVAGGWRWRVSSGGAVWLWLNREGSGLLWGERDRFILKPGMFAMTGGGRPAEWSCVRFPGQHRMEVVVLSREWLVERLGKGGEGLHPELARWLRDGGGVGFCGLMGACERRLCEELEKASVESGKGRLRVEARVLDWAAARFFEKERGEEGEAAGLVPVASRRRDPVRRALDLLRLRVNEPLDLESLAKEVGVAPHLLSRRVSTETGRTLQRHLRRLRVERACEAMGSRKMSVTEAALKVGYQSLSHFAKAFREEMGNTPSGWLSGMRSC